MRKFNRDLSSFKVPEEVMRKLLSEGQIVKLYPTSGGRMSKFIGLEVVGEEIQEHIYFKNKIGI